MSPITLFFGTNSSGKSSIGQFLMMLKQTALSSERKAVFFPGDGNSAVELGSFQEMVFHRDPENKISFQYQWDFEPILKFKDTKSSTTYSGNDMSFDAEVSLDTKNQNTLIVEHFKYDVAGISVTMKRAEDKHEYKVDSTGYSLVRQLQRAWPFKAPYKFYAFPEEVVAYHQNADFVQQLNLQHEKLFRSVFYLGPMREKPARLYKWTGTEPESVGNAGEDTIPALLAAKKRRIGLGHKRPTKPFEEIIASKLKEMGLIDEFKVKRIAEGRHEYDVKVRTKGSKDYVDLPDVGFGISQVLPVLVQCFYAPKNSVIIMEQPEIHLHPSAQAALADVFIDVINSKEYGENRNIQLIVETHSEHFLRRLQKRIAEDNVSKDKVSAYFANVAAYPPKLEELKIDLFGNVLNWPENFFGDVAGDIADQTVAALKKRKAQMNKK